MAELKLHWSKMEADEYRIYRSSLPGQGYSLVDTVTPSGEDVEEYIFQRAIPITNLQGLGSAHTANLAWDSGQGGSPELFKIVACNPDPSFVPSNDAIWMDDNLPTGALWLSNDGSTWDTFGISGTASLRIEATDGYTYPQFDSATPCTRRYLVLWVHIDPEHIPDSLMISLYDGSWNHRAYWGKDLFPYGVEGTQSMYYMGTIPMPGCWTPLVIDKELLGVSNITGMGFGVYREPDEGAGPQTAIIHIDTVCISDQRIYVADQQHIPIDKYIVSRRCFNEASFSKIGESIIKSFIDENAPDVFGYSSTNYSPVFTLKPHPSGTSVNISWTVPIGSGTQYTYRVAAVDAQGEQYDPAESTVAVNTNHGYIVVKGGIAESYDALPVLATVLGNQYTHEDLEKNTTYMYRLETYDPDDQLISTYDVSVTTLAGSLLGYFILGQSPLA